jgi:hypothetical protein
MAVEYPDDHHYHCSAYDCDHCDISASAYSRREHLTNSAHRHDLRRIVRASKCLLEPRSWTREFIRTWNKGIWYVTCLLLSGSLRRHNVNADMPAKSE